jgi:nucleotide-binding universal stress UspA family protein
MDIKNILVPVDMSPATGRIVAYACAMAALFHSSVCLLHVTMPDPDFVGYKPGPQYVRNMAFQNICVERKQFYKIKEQFTACGITVKAIIIQGEPAGKILREAKRNKSGLIIMGAHLHGKLYTALFGSVGETVLRKIPCPILVVNKEAAKPVRSKEYAA